ncbi:hypothetical protein [Arthrobacter sp. FW306-2-2C-D06B]|uniref:hypothetical protein n=1 Tax=Arthrobacter sp. FW306-2-2C-D06B TaxID=2879618 RepID=UPI001F2BFB6D|nr:hypothetical protein [Arthrobacter sp. FW306-2-2C-D06B]UKA60555.1 hypothetical protein LFT47_09600 [Arthrobacter sp. FW306-2-2C-D06B]
MEHQNDKQPGSFWSFMVAREGRGMPCSVLAPVRPVRPVAREFAKGSDENLSLTGRAS